MPGCHEGLPYRRQGHPGIRTETQGARDQQGQVPANPGEAAHRERAHVSDFLKEQARQRRSPEPRQTCEGLNGKQATAGSDEPEKECFAEQREGYEAIV